MLIAQYIYKRYIKYNKIDIYLNLMTNNCSVYTQATSNYKSTLYVENLQYVKPIDYKKQYRQN